MGYYLGLDMGTNSVGWAVTDEDYKLLRFKRKDMWGIREFDEAEAAADRRSHRTSRRRRQRQIVRRGLLRSYFADAIHDVDPMFFVRLDNSKYFMEDKAEGILSESVIFDDDNYKDADYYKEYPTIFHLRKALLEDKALHDVRLVYLAISNMFKHRGNFLIEGLEVGSNDEKLSDMYKTVSKMAQDLFGIALKTDVDLNKYEDIVSSRQYSRSRKAELLCELLQISNSEKKEKAIIKSMCGLKVRLIDFLGDSGTQIADEDKNFSFSFSDSDFDEKILQIEEKTDEDITTLVTTIKAIYDKAILLEIMKDQPYLSYARVADYEKHAKDLKVLKRVFRKYLSKEEYDKFFRSEEKGTYSAYVNSFNSDKKVRRNYKERKQEDLYKAIKSKLKDLKETEDTDIVYILNEIDTENFLPKQLTFKNGVIPNQVHAKELHDILKKAETYLPFLKEIDASGFTVSERVEKLFTFRIPYYVGPVSEKSNGWVVRREAGPVLPWNIDSKIDLKQTSEKFIGRMVRNCTYLSGEQVMPKASLLYERYKVLNEINNIKIDGEDISVELKQEIYTTLFLTGKRVTRKKIFEFLYARGLIQEKEQLTGIDITVNNSMSTYGKFLAIFGEERMKKEEYQNMVDDIVFWCTIYGDSKQFLRGRLEEKYKDKLDEKQIKRIIGFKFKDWGNLSKEFLQLAGCDKSTGEILPLIEAMWTTNYNMMELLHSDRFTYQESLAEKQGNAVRLLSEYSREDLEKEYFSAPVKRMIWQTLKIIKEIEHIMNAAPDRIFVEMTRRDGEKGDRGRKSSRKDQLTALYKNITDEDAAWKKEMISRIDRFDADGSLRSKKLYLYFTQKGLDMYTGKPIDLDDLLNANSRYDIDHIYPRHFVKDDNINNNLVLASKSANNEKQDTYPIKDSIYQNMKDTWKMLREAGLITEEKYKRLTGRTPFTEEQKAGFIARQLVETSQGTKGVADLLKTLLPDTKLIYSKANNVSEFRHKFDIPKSRLINDFHHANDAYLNIVVGNVYYTKFTQNPLNFIKKEYESGDKKYEYNLSKMFERDVERDGTIAWIVQKEQVPGTIATVKKMISKNTPILTRLPIEGHGGIADATLYSHEKAKPGVYIPLKTSDARLMDVTKYGGYTSATVAYIFLVEHEVKGKKVRTLETVPLYLKDKIEKKEGGLEQYCCEVLGYSNPSVRVKKIRMQSLIKLNKYYVQISGKTDKQFGVRNYVQLCLQKDWIAYIHKLEKYQERTVLDTAVTIEKNIELYDILCQKHNTGIFSKRPNPVGEKLVNARDKFAALSIEDQIFVLVQIIGLSAVGIACADLKLIGGGSQSGTMKISKKISGAEECILINQSVTGLYENRIDLLTV